MYIPVLKTVSCDIINDKTNPIICFEKKCQIYKSMLLDQNFTEKNN